MAGAHSPRAIFATSDEQALSALRAATRVGKRVPEDVAFVGFDGIAEALSGQTRITTIAQPLHALVV